MGQARARAREIVELKRLGVRQLATPWAASPVMLFMQDGMTMIMDREFGQALEAAQAAPWTPEAQTELARLALWAERSGVKEAVCQAWFYLELKKLHNNHKSQARAK
jgi:hypothetical protein